MDALHDPIFPPPDHHSPPRKALLPLNVRPVNARPIGIDDDSLVIIGIVRSTDKSGRRVGHLADPAVRADQTADDCVYRRVLLNVIRHEQENKMRDRIMIVGAGAIGGVLAGYLAAAGRRVTLFVRGDTARMVAEQGIRLTTPDQRILHSRPRVVTSISAAGEQDIVLFATKAFSLPAAMQSVLPAIGPKTVVAPVVNGVPWWFGTALHPVRAVDPDGSLIGAIPADRLVGATIYSPARRTDSGEWIHMVPGKLVVGPILAGQSDAAAKRVAAAFEGTGYGAVVTADIHRAVWSKLATNGSFNPLCSLTGAQQIDVARDKTLGACALAIIQEIETLARACGSGIEGVVQTYFDQAYNRGTHKPSTLHDFEAGRQVELAAIVDAPLELALQRGVAMPTLALIGAAVRLKALSAGLLPDATHVGTNTASGSMQ